MLGFDAQNVLLSSPKNGSLLSAFTQIPAASRLILGIIDCRNMGALSPVSVTPPINGSGTWCELDIRWVFDPSLAIASYPPLQVIATPFITNTVGETQSNFDTIAQSYHPAFVNQAYGTRIGSYHVRSGAASFADIIPVQAPYALVSLVNHQAVAVNFVANTNFFYQLFPGDPTTVRKDVWDGWIWSSVAPGTALPVGATTVEVGIIVPGPSTLIVGGPTTYTVQIGHHQFITDVIQYIHQGAPNANGFIKLDFEATRTPLQLIINNTGAASSYRYTLMRRSY